MQNPTYSCIIIARKGDDMENQCLYEPLNNVLECRHKKASGYQTYSYHRHDGYEVYLFLSGNILFYQNYNCYRLTPGDLIILPPTCMHRIISIDESVYERVTLNIQHSVIDRLSTANTNLFKCFEMTENASPIHLENDEIIEFIRLADLLISSMDSEEFGSDVLANAYISQLLLLINNCYRVNDSSKVSIMPELVKNVMLYISDNLSGDLSLAKISSQFYHNGTYISRMFKKHTGLTLKEYIIDQRIDVAKQILSKGGNVQEACYKSGFSDYSNFIRSFTSAIGTSPGKYRQESLRKSGKK